MHFASTPVTLSCYGTTHSYHNCGRDSQNGRRYFSTESTFSSPPPFDVDIILAIEDARLSRSIDKVSPLVQELFQSTRKYRMKHQSAPLHLDHYNRILAVLQKLLPGRYRPKFLLYPNTVESSSAICTHPAARRDIMIGIIRSRKLVAQTAMEVLQELQLDTTPDLKTYHLLLCCLARCYDKNNAETVWNMLRKQQELPFDISVFNAMLTVMCRTRKIRRANELMKELPTLGGSPNLITFSIIIETCIQARDFLSGSYWVEQIKSNPTIVPDISLYCIMLNLSFLAKYPLEHAWKLWNEITVEKQLKPNAYSMCTLINLITKHGDQASWDRLKEEWKKYDIELNFALCANFISGCVHFSDIEFCVSFYDRMIFQKLVPTQAMYCQLLQLCVKKGHMQVAWQLFTDLQTYEILISIPIVNRMLQVVSKCDDRHHFHLLAKFLKSSNLKPNRLTYDMVFDLYVRYGEVDAAYQTLEAMLQRGYSPFRHSVRKFIVLCGETSCPDLAVKLVRDLTAVHKIPPSSEMFTTLLKTVVPDYTVRQLSEKDEGLIRESIRLTLSSQMSANIAVDTALIKAYTRLGQFNEAERLFNEVKSRGTRPDHILFGAMLWLCVVKRDPEQAQSLFYSIIHHGLTPRGVDVEMMLDCLKDWTYEERQVFYAKLLSRFPDSRIRPEVMYLLEPEDNTTSRGNQPMKYAEQEDDEISASTARLRRSDSSLDASQFEDELDD